MSENVKLDVVKITPEQFTKLVATNQVNTNNVSAIAQALTSGSGVKTELLDGIDPEKLKEIGIVTSIIDMDKIINDAMGMGVMHLASPEVATFLEDTAKEIPNDKKETQELPVTDSKTNNTDIAGVTPGQQKSLTNAPANQIVILADLSEPAPAEPAASTAAQPEESIYDVVGPMHVLSHQTTTFIDNAAKANNQGKEPAEDKAAEQAPVAESATTDTTLAAQPAAAPTPSAETTKVAGEPAPAAPTQPTAPAQTAPVASATPAEVKPNSAKIKAGQAELLKQAKEIFGEDIPKKLTVEFLKNTIKTKTDEYDTNLRGSNGVENEELKKDKEQLDKLTKFKDSFQKFIKDNKLYSDIDLNKSVEYQMLSQEEKGIYTYAPIQNLSVTKLSADDFNKLQALKDAVSKYLQKPKEDELDVYNVNRLTLKDMDMKVAEQQKIIDSNNEIVSNDNEPDDVKEVAAQEKAAAEQQQKAFQDLKDFVQSHFELKEMAGSNKPLRYEERAPETFDVTKLSEEDVKLNNAKLQSVSEALKESHFSAPTLAKLTINDFNDLIKKYDKDDNAKKVLTDYRDFMKAKIAEQNDPAWYETAWDYTKTGLGVAIGTPIVETVKVAKSLAGEIPANVKAADGRTKMNFYDGWSNETNKNEDGTDKSLTRRIAEGTAQGLGAIVINTAKSVPENVSSFIGKGTDVTESMTRSAENQETLNKTGMAKGTLAPITFTSAAGNLVAATCDGLSYVVGLDFVLNQNEVVERVAKKTMEYIKERGEDTSDENVNEMRHVTDMCRQLGLSKKEMSEISEEQLQKLIKSKYNLIESEVIVKNAAAFSLITARDEHGKLLIVSKDVALEKFKKAGAQVKEAFDDGGALVLGLVNEATDIGTAVKNAVKDPELPTLSTAKDGTVQKESQDFLNAVSADPVRNITTAAANGLGTLLGDNMIGNAVKTGIKGLGDMSADTVESATSLGTGQVGKTFEKLGDVAETAIVKPWKAFTGLFGGDDEEETKPVAQKADDAKATPAATQTPANATDKPADTKVTADKVDDKSVAEQKKTEKEVAKVKTVIPAETAADIKKAAIKQTDFYKNTQADVNKAINECLEMFCPKEQIEQLTKDLTNDKIKNLQAAKAKNSGNEKLSQKYDYLILLQQASIETDDSKKADMVNKMVALLKTRNSSKTDAEIKAYVEKRIEKMQVRNKLQVTTPLSNIMQAGFNKIDVTRLMKIFRNEKLFGKDENWTWTRLMNIADHVAKQTKLSEEDLDCLKQFENIIKGFGAGPLSAIVNDSTLTAYQIAGMVPFIAGLHAVFLMGLGTNEHIQSLKEWLTSKGNNAQKEGAALKLGYALFKDIIIWWTKNEEQKKIQQQKTTKKSDPVTPKKKTTDPMNKDPGPDPMENDPYTPTGDDPVNPYDIDPDMPFIE